MTGISDTGSIVAFLNRRDAYHDWAVGLARHVDAPLITCEAVLAEAVFHTGSAEKVLELLSLGLLRIDFDLESCRPRLERLAKRYADRLPDLADLCLVCLSERYTDHPIFTLDHDFQIYRRHQREAIPLVMPADSG